MIPVVTPAEMNAIDASAPEPVRVLVGRAGSAVARRALAMMGGGYGRRVVVVAGKGNNGADGREAARLLRRRGARVVVLDASAPPEEVPESDLVVDAAYGTGFRGSYRAPTAGRAPVLSVDIPSGVDGLTGEAAEGAVRASETVTFAALKPGLLLHQGRQLTGRVTVADIGLDVSVARAGLIERADAVSWLPSRRPDAHKWDSALWVLAGSPGMTGAARLCAAAAQRAGSGMVLVSVPGLDDMGEPAEAVHRALPAAGWDRSVRAGLDRVGALAVGPGLGRGHAAIEAVRGLLPAAAVPAVVDADALFALGDAASARAVLSERRHPTVLTPHDGEFARLCGAGPGADRITSVRQLAAAIGATVLLKGSPTVVADPAGEVVIVASGDHRLATAGTGDVLTGIVGAYLARGLDGLRAAAAAAFVHGEAGRLGWRSGLVASDLPALIPAVLHPPADEVFEVTRWL